MNLFESNILVTGASSGIGRATALALGKAGANVALLARRQERLDELAAEIRAAGMGEALPLSADVTQPVELAAALNSARSRFGELDAAVFAAGVGIFRNFTDLTHDEWQKQIDVLLGSVYQGVRAVLPAMLTRGRGHLVVVSSRFAAEGAEKSTAYCAAKFALKGFLDSLRREVRRQGIKVSNVMPGTVQTELFEKDWDVDFEKVLQPQDVAAVIVDALNKPDRCVVEEVLVQSRDYPY